MSKKAYTAAQFDHVEGLEAIQLRPGMFVSDAGDAAVEVLFREVLDNSIDEAMNGHGNLIEVTVVGDRVTVRDRGRGIPIEPHPKHPNISVLEVVLTKLHSGAKLRGEYGVSGGLHGIGLKALTALAENLEVEVRRGGRIVADELERFRQAVLADEFHRNVRQCRGKRRLQNFDDRVLLVVPDDDVVCIHRFLGASGKRQYPRNQHNGE